MDQQEDDLYRERDKLRARSRRRERDQMEKATHGIRVAAIRTLKSLLRQAQQQAAKGKPALLRLILRSTR